MWIISLFHPVGMLSLFYTSPICPAIFSVRVINLLPNLWSGWVFYGSSVLANLWKNHGWLFSVRWVVSELYFSLPEGMFIKRTLDWHY